jgi:hypothetical protein
VPTLADIQELLRGAVVGGETAAAGKLLTGGKYPQRRLEIHRRNYETSLVMALLAKFPATVWLIGSPFVTEAAKRFVLEHPPFAPCIAEYGEAFPRYLSATPAAGRAPYVGEFAELEWHAGHVTVAADEAAVLWDELMSLHAAKIFETPLLLQAGVRYLKASWPIDELLKLYLSESAPERLSFEPAEVWLEIRGSRGEFNIHRLDAAEFIFRKSISEGRSVGEAAECALDADSAFDAGRALAMLIGAGLVIAIQESGKGEML